MLARKHEVYRSNSRARDFLCRKAMFRRDIEINMFKLERLMNEGVATASQGMHAVMHTHVTKPQEFHEHVTTPLAEAIDEVMKRGGDSVQVAVRVLEIFGLDAKTAEQTVT
jgi:hypothetical protein